MKIQLSLLILLCALATFAQSETKSAAGTIAESANPGSTHSWVSVANAGASDNAYTSPGGMGSNGDQTTFIKLTNWGFAIPSSSVINGIEVEVERNTDHPTRSKDDLIFIVKGGTIGATDRSVSGAWDMAEAYFLYGTDTDLWGETWTDADINSSGFGVAISTKRVGGGAGTVTPNIDHVRITVTYTAPLPIKLIAFTGESENGIINLAWTTASEQNNDFFTIERSTNGATFEEVARIPGSGTTETSQKYSAADKTPQPGTNYYRLKQTDYNGEFEYSNPIAVKNVQSQSSCAINVNPNPCTPVCNVALNGCNGEEFVNVGLYDAAGNTIISSVPISSGNGFYIDSKNQLAPGTYVLSGGSATGRVSKKLSVQ